MVQCDLSFGWLCLLLLLWHIANVAGAKHSTKSQDCSGGAGSLLPTFTPQLPRGTLEGLNDWKRTGYGGPCPPIGRHRYFFKLYALDFVIGDLSAPNKVALETAMRGHILAQAELIGTYEKVGAKRES